MAKYEKHGVHYDVYSILAVEERDHHTMQLTFDDAGRGNKHVISREAYLAHKPKPKDRLVIAGHGEVTIVPQGHPFDLTPVTDAPSLETPVTDAPSLETPVPVVATTGDPKEEVNVAKTLTDAAQSLLQSSALTASTTAK